MGRKICAASFLICCGRGWIYQIYVDVTEGLEIVTSRKIALAVTNWTSWELGYVRATQVPMKGFSSDIRCKVLIRSIDRLDA
jgi:hypothetical protein